MNKRIEKKIVGYKVTTQEQAKEAAAGVAAKEAESNIIQMHEKVSRPEALAGSTYKIKTPISDHALYLTINDIVLNEGTDHEL
ncbi:MAG: NrdJb, partial [Porticoccaceae bacterium]|nr:NrdJb [Porticoccaceae bacterium]